MKKTTVLRIVKASLVLIVLCGISIQKANAQSLTSTWATISTKGTGHSVAQAGDVNGDSYNDMIVTNPYYTNGQVYEGKIMLYYGSSTGFASTPAWTAESNCDSAYLGWSVAGMCDINGDGYTDIITGAPGTDNVQGKVYVYYGSSSGLSSSPVTISENQSGERFGFALATADANNDGYSEVFIGAPYYNGGSSSSGRVYAYFSTSSGLPSVATWHITGSGQYSGFGWSLAVGSVTASITNNKTNLIIGAPGTDPSATACVTLTDTLPTDPVSPPTKKFILTDSSSGSKFGYSLAIAGDINHDGYQDIITGAPNYTNGQTNEGKATVYQGSSSSISAIWSAEGNEAGANFGTCVAGEGKINNDTLDDIAITSPGAQTTSLSVYPGTSSGISGSKYSLINLADEFSTVAFFRTSSGQDGLIAGAPIMTRGSEIGKGETKYIKEIEDWIKREGVTQEITTKNNRIDQLSPAIRTFPNPAGKQLTLEITSAVAARITGIEIVNALGVIALRMNEVQITRNGVVQQIAIDLPSLPAGMYYAVVHLAGQKLFQPVQINQ